MAWKAARIERVSPAMPSSPPLDGGLKSGRRCPSVTRGSLVPKMCNPESGIRVNTGDSRLLNSGCALRGTLAGQVVVSSRGLPGGSARRRRPTSFSNLLMVLSPASAGAPGPVCVAWRRVATSLGSSAFLSQYAEVGTAIIINGKDNQRKDGLTVIATLGNVAGYSGAPETMRAVRGMKNNVPPSGSDVEKQVTVPRFCLAATLFVAY